MTKPAMVMRSVRVPLALWTAALAVAEERDENVSDVIREALRLYVNPSLSAPAPRPLPPGRVYHDWREEEMGS